YRFVWAGLLAAVTLGWPMPVGAQAANPPQPLGCAGRPGPRPGYHFEFQWNTVAPFPDSDMQGICRPRVVSFDHECNIYVADTTGNQVVKYSPEGERLDRFKLSSRDPGVEGPLGLAVDSAGNLYVADHAKAVVDKLASDGKRIAVWGA